MQRSIEPHRGAHTAVTLSGGSAAASPSASGMAAASASLLYEPILVHDRKRRTTALLLCLFFGWLGCHRFYVGKRSSGRLYLLTSGLLFAGVIVDFVLILIGSFEDSFGQPLI